MTSVPPRRSARPPSSRPRTTPLSLLVVAMAHTNILARDESMRHVLSLKAHDESTRAMGVDATTLVDDISYVLAGRGAWEEA